MKLLLQSDDYGISRAVARGIVYGIDQGLIRNTGLFANMPWAEECVEWIRPCLRQIAFGLDLNLTTGRPILPPERIPSLVNAEGRFHTSWESRKLDAALGGADHASRQEVLLECEAQIQRFIALVGKKPDYIHPHAYTTPRIMEVQRELAHQYGIPYSSDVWQRLAGFGVPEYRIGWYKKPATLENQMNSSLKEYVLTHSAELLARDVCIVAGHMGYLDRDLMELSTYTLYRVNDLADVVSEELKAWVKDNRVELITYRDL